ELESGLEIPRDAANGCLRPRDIRRGHRRNDSRRGACCRSCFRPGLPRISFGTGEDVEVENNSTHNGEAGQKGQLFLLTAQIHCSTPVSSRTNASSLKLTLTTGPTG